MRGSSHKPPKPVSRIPTSPSPVLNDTERKVQIGFRPIGGRAAAWTFGIVHKLFKGFDKKDDGADGTRQRAPDPHYHWCVLVGDYYHQIQITDGMIWYDNNKTSWKDGWSVFEVGVTKFNDAAIADAAAKTVLGMPENYNLWTNNCHHFVLRLLNHICTTDQHWDKLGTPRHRRESISSGSEGLFAEGCPLYKTVVDKPEATPTKAANNAENIMAQNTPSVIPDELKISSESYSARAMILGKCYHPRP